MSIIPRSAVRELLVDPWPMGVKFSSGRVVGWGEWVFQSCLGALGGQNSGFMTMFWQKCHFFTFYEFFIKILMVFQTEGGVSWIQHEKIYFVNFFHHLPPIPHNSP